MFDLLLRKKTFTVEMIISKKVGNHFLLGNGSQPPKYFADAKIQLQWVFQMFEKFAEKFLDDFGKRFQVSPSGSITVFQLDFEIHLKKITTLFTFRYIHSD